MKSNNKDNKNSVSEPVVGVAIAGASMAVAGGIAAACCAPALMLVGVGALVFAALASGGNGDEDVWGG